MGSGSPSGNPTKETIQKLPVKCPTLFVVQDDLAQRKAIELGLAYEGDIEILAGLDDEAKVVVVGQNGLKDGARVEVIN